MKDWLAYLLRRYPIRARATWALLISLVGTVGIQLGLDQILAEEIQHVLTAVLDLFVLIGLVSSSERVVTPVADPRDDAGNRLTPGPVGYDGEI